MVEIQTNRSIDISNTINTAIMNWSPDGKNQFNELYKQLLNDDKDKFEAELAIKQLLVSLCKSCLQGSQSVETVIRIFGELQEIVSCSSIIGDLLADIFATLDVELFPNDDTITKDTYKQRFFQLINNSEHIVSTTLLMERLEIETLEYLDLIVSREQFSQKYVRIKTRLYYKQQKFNLLREESEGFAKTLTELNQNFSITKLTSEQLYDRLMALIGYFDIDPNRMLDLVIESFEYHLEYTKIYVNLLNLLHFDKITLCQLIGFKFQQYQLQDETADSLYLLAAQLISNNIIELEDLLPHLYPLITDFSDNYIKEIEHVRTSKKSLTSSKDSNTIKTNNQLLHFIQALLYVGDLEHILILFNNLPRWSCTSYREINILLTKIIAYMIDPFYKSNSDLHMCFLQYELNNPLNLNICPRNLNLIKNWNEFRENIYPLLLHLGPYCQDRLLYMQLTRLCTNIIKKPIITDEQQEDIILLIDEVLLPSLSLLDVNSCLAIELWSLMKLFPFDIRYGLYGQWHEDTYRKTPQLMFIKQDVTDKTRAILRRITKDNVKTYSRQIAKMTHNNPIIILAVIIDQIQRFDNFISVINDALKYLSPLAYDIVCYTILHALTSPISSTSIPTYIDGKMSRENATPAQWFQNLCVLSANVFKKYPIDFTSILYYIYDQLRLEKTCDLYLLREIITKMSGVEVTSTVTREQLEAASGGELLRSEAGQFTAARNVKKPSIRLKEALIDNHLYLPLSIIIAQQRSCIVFKFGAQRIEHLKLIGSLYDQCQDTMVQFFTFLSNVLTTENFHHKFPSIDDLVLGFHLQVDAAFQISRPLFNLNIQAKFDEFRSTASKSLNKNALIQNYIEAVTYVMSPVLDFVKTLHPQRTWEEMTPQFYLTFWSLSMSDLQVPEIAYKRRIEELELEMTQIDERKELTAAKKRKEKEKIHIIIDKLKEELFKQKEHVERVRARLDIEREHWFKNRNKTKAETITEFLQLCIFPRCLLSEIDALYCAHFIRVIHDLVTPNFSTIICYDRLFSDISYSLASCSENEAIRYGRFLESLLETVMSWHGDKNKFDKECATHPGFLTVFRNAGNAATKTTGTTQTPEQLDYDNFRHVCHKWHYKLAKSFIVCLDSNDYIQIRNVLQVLTVLLPIYPKMTTFYAALERRIKAICAAEKDRRHDLFALAKCYSGRLAHKHRDMIEESQFHSVPERQTSSSSSTSNQNNNNNNQNNNNNNNAGTKMNPIVTPTIIGDTNNVNHHPILSDIQSTSSPTTRSIQKDSLTSNTTARPTSEKSMNVSTTSNGSTTATKSSSPAPSSQPTAPTSRSATITNITERSTSKTKTEPVIINSSSNSSSTTATISSTKSNRIPHGPSLPSSKTTVTSTTQNKIESNETSTSMTGRTIKLSNNPTDRHESPQASTISTLRESPPTNKKDTSTTIDRRPTSSTTEQQISSSKTSSAPVSRPTSSRTVTSTTRSSTSSVATTNDDSIRRSDQTATNGINSSTSSKTLRTESPHEHVPVEKKSRSGSSKGDRITTSHVDESRNSSSRSTHREHKHESNKRARSSTPEKRSANGGNSGSSSRRLNQTAESTLSTTPVHQDNEHSSGSGIMDVSPSSLSSKRIKTSDTISNGRSTRKEAREERHTSSSSSHRVSSSSRSDRRDK
ncbi:unnamed protein product [Rotaria sp. Silwood1]|nr:unnamed protein product [Rotaria sp. Silwood1]